MTAKDHKSEGFSADSGVAFQRSGYTSSDVEQFDKLMNFPSIAADTTAGNRPPSDMPPLPAVQHTEQDLLEFQRLTTFDSGRRSPPHTARQSGHSTTTGVGYTESDNRLFEDLTSLSDTRGAPTHTAAADRETDTPVAQNYTRRDLQAFGKLTPGAPLGEDANADVGDNISATPNTAIGHIRIVDFDSEQARKRESERRGAADIKIRYFD